MSVAVQALAWLGRGGHALGAEVAGILALLRRSTTALRRMEGREALRQAYELGNRSLFFVLVIMSFTGAIMVVQACVQAQRIIGDLTVIGPGFLQLCVREFGPTIVALMIAARYGAGIAAELGAMQITEQVDALRLCGADAPSFLVAPRVVGGLIGMLPVAILGSATAFISGGVAARYAFGVGWENYLRLTLVEYGDVVVGVAKAVSYGIAVPLVSSYAGLNARGGAPGVGRATTYAVIGSSVGVLFLDLVVGG
ncbi:MAG: ABC transporter permease, partial [Deltaproteobacteria bacterium]|nr:ABC transporter permease [Deltaproteobacteria bacterium]